MSVSKNKFVDDGTHILDFMYEYFVVCPRCEECATVAVIEIAPMLLFSPRRLTCTHCGYTSEWRGNGVTSRFDQEPRDWYFKQPFYYRTPCCGHELWVLNREHLDFLREFVDARLRSRSVTARGWSNRSLVSRLPRWISSGKRRDEILAALEKIDQLMEKREISSSSRIAIRRRDEVRTKKVKPVPSASVYHRIKRLSDE